MRHLETWQRENLPDARPTLRKENLGHRLHFAVPASSSTKWTNPHFQCPSKLAPAKLLALCSKSCQSSYSPTVHCLPPLTRWPCIPHINIHWVRAKSSHWCVRVFWFSRKLCKLRTGFYYILCLNFLLKPTGII